MDSNKTLLHEYDLLEVFKYVKTNDRKTARLVCKYWNQTIKDWPRFTREAWLPLGHTILDNATLEMVKPNAYQNVLLLADKLFFDSETDEDKFFNDIGPAITNLNICETYETVYPLIHQTDVMHKLRQEFNIQELIYKFPKLKRICFNSFYDIWSFKLPETIESIHIEGEYGLPEKISSNCMERLRGLKNLKSLTSNMVRKAGMTDSGKFVVFDFEMNERLFTVSDTVEELTRDDIRFRIVPTLNFLDIPEIQMIHLEN